MLTAPWLKKKLVRYSYLLPKYHVKMVDFLLFHILSKGHFLQVTLILVVDIPTQILLTKFLSIDHSSMYKLKVCIITHTKEKPSTTIDIFFAQWVKQWKAIERAKFSLKCLLSICIYSNSKSRVTCTKAHFECQYIRTHTKEKQSKISKITFAICHFIRKKYPNWMAILSTLESTTLDETIRCASKWFILT